MSDAPRTYPDKLEVKPLTKPPVATVRVPGSKSITNRALVLAALSGMDVPLRLEGALRSEDTEVMVNCLRRLGCAIEPLWDESCILFPFEERRRIPAESADLYVANSGTTMRFLTAMVTAGDGRYRLDGVARMRERPIQDLLDALNQFAGVRAYSERGNGCPPIVVETSGLRGGHITVRADTSSQFLSGLLLVAPFAEDDVMISVEGPTVSEPYVGMTIEMVRQWGGEVEEFGTNRYLVPAGCVIDNPMNYQIEPDASAASYFFAAAAIAGGSVTVDGYIPPHITLQGDIEFLPVLERMGCTIERDLLWNIAHAGQHLRGIDVDMNAISDTVMTLAAVACFAEGPTTIRNVAHIRHKETDRLAALATELRRVGAEVDEFADGLTITPRPLHGAEIETYNDHRMAMSMALIGLRVPGIAIKNPGCVAKTYPGFWDDLQALYH